MEEKEAIVILNSKEDEALSLKTPEELRAMIANLK